MWFFNYLLDLSTQNPVVKKEILPIKLKLGEVDIKRQHCTEEQVIGILNERTPSLPENGVIRRHGFAHETFCRWKSNYSGMDVSAVKRIRELKAENAKLKKLLAETLSETTTRKVTLTIEILTEKRKHQVQITLTKDV